jgi:hypothetical protein
LDFVGVDDSSNVGVGNDTRRNTESTLQRGIGLLGSKNVVELLEGTLGPDDEPSDVTTRGELEKVKAKE